MTEAMQTFPLEAGLDEERLWQEYAKPRLQGVKPNVLAICHYGFTEMVNNVIDHSGSSALTLEIVHDLESIRFWVMDFGVGIFRKLRDALELESEHAAALELAKGRVTTDPERHTGEGIFFAARMFDKFIISSGEITFLFESGRDDWLSETIKEKLEGTCVQMSIRGDSDRTSQEVFERFASSGGGFVFDTTVLHLKLFGEGGGRLVSRSQAKRILARTDVFKTVVLDFNGVEEISPAFVDEVFRVFANAHPDIRLLPIRASEVVDQMLLRAVTRNGEAGPKA